MASLGELSQVMQNFDPYGEFRKGMMTSQKYDIEQSILDEQTKEIEADRTKVFDIFERAIASGDDKDYDKAEKEMDEFNKRNPLVPIDASQIQPPLRGRAQRRATSILGAQPSRRFYPYMADAMSAYEDTEDESEE